MTRSKKTMMSVRPLDLLLSASFMPSWMGTGGSSKMVLSSMACGSKSGLPGVGMSEPVAGAAPATAPAGFRGMGPEVGSNGLGMFKREVRPGAPYGRAGAAADAAMRGPREPETEGAFTDMPVLAAGLHAENGPGRSGTEADNGPEVRPNEAAAAPAKAP